MNVTLIGAGMGAPGNLTRDADAALAAADVVIGSERLIGSLAPLYSARMIAAALPEKMAAIIEAHPEWRDVCVVLSGDVGFYSGAKKLTALLARHNPKLICGVAAPVYLASRLGRPWQSFRLVSAHGNGCDVLAEVLNHPEVFFLAGGRVGPADIIADLLHADLGDALVTVGENLSSPEERITTGRAADLAGRAFAPLSVALVENGLTFARPPGPAGLEDGAFLRGGTPMTKREIRAVALSLLRPSVDSVIYDVGAGTGSVAVELALQARRGRVYAVERDADALDLVRSNRTRFGVYNMHVVAGAAPDALANLPAPDAAFIGGSGGRLRDVLHALIQKNPRVRAVVSAIALETLSTAFAAMDELGFRDVETCQVSVARTTLRGGLRMLDGLNPVFLVAGGGRGGD